MDSVTIYIENKMQATIIRSFLKEVKLKHEFQKKDKTKMTKEELIKKVNTATKEFDEGKFITISSKKELKELLNV